MRSPKIYDNPKIYSEKNKRKSNLWLVAFKLHTEQNNNFH